jgi:FPC/CPF motif-containing protein YcgG
VTGDATQLAMDRFEERIIADKDLFPCLQRRH